MRTVELIATLETVVKVIKVNRLTGTVTLEVEGKTTVLDEGMEIVLTLEGSYRHV